MSSSFSNDMVSINSRPLCNLLKIKPSEVKNGEKRQAAGPQARLYLMERAEQTEGLASMR